MAKHFPDTLVSNLKKFTGMKTLFFLHIAVVFKQRQAFYFKCVTVGVWLKSMGGMEEINVYTEMQHTPTAQVE